MKALDLVVLRNKFYADRYKSSLFLAKLLLLLQYSIGGLIGVSLP